MSTMQPPASDGAVNGNAQHVGLQDAVASTSSGSNNSGDASAVIDQATNLAEHPNMHFDTQSGKWMYENVETGQEFEWSTAANAWVPVLDEEVVKAQQAAYSVEGVDDSTPATVILARDRRKKRKAGDNGGDGNAGEGSSTGGGPSKKQAKYKSGPRNTAVFVQRLPLDATVEEVNEVFSKAGFILPDADGQPKIKLYSDKATGQRNGDGLVVYLKEESVQLALSLLDDSPLRLGEKDTIKITKAEWSHKAADGTSKDGDAGTAGQGPAKGKGRAQKMQKRAEKMLKDAADYDPSYDERDSPLVTVAATASSKATGSRVAILSGVFTLEEIAEDASLLLDLKEDVREECEGLGKVTNVVLYDNEANGIVSIKFADEVAAQACVIKNNGRFFGGRQLKAWLYDGKTRYQKSGGVESAILEGEDGEAAEKRRLEEFGKWLATDES